jgi:AP-1-like factor
MAPGDHGTMPSNLTSLRLTQQQQDLLLAALASNTSPDGITSADPTGADPLSGFDESTLLDSFDYDFGNGDASFEFGNSVGDDTLASIDGGEAWPNAIGDNPDSSRSNSTEGPETHEKRSYPDDDEDDEEAGGKNRAKRREGPEKVPKKPGRKPLVDEPTTKRKAQNRAAQRAFRERKEKHLKDLETKVEELQKVSDDSHHENETLREQLQRVMAELEEYKQRVAALSTNRSTNRDRMPSQGGFGSAAVHNLGDVHFQFEFPKFGVLPGPPPDNMDIIKSPSPMSPQQTNLGQRSTSQHQPIQSADGGMAQRSVAATPPGAGSSPGTHQLPYKAGSRGSIGSLPSIVGGALASSPSVSSHNSITGASSCGTSPEPFTQSPLGFKTVDTMTTIGEEPTGLSGISTIDAYGDPNANSLDWLMKQNGGHFDPQIFGDYRDPQDAAFGNGLFGDNILNDIDVDFSTAYFTPPPIQLEKKSLVNVIDEQKNSDEGPLPTGKSDMYSTEQIWYGPPLGQSVSALGQHDLTSPPREKLRDCEKVQSGEVDMDALCAELSKKATCNGYGPEVDQRDFNKAMGKFIPGFAVPGK